MVIERTSEQARKSEKGKRMLYSFSNLTYVVTVPAQALVSVIAAH